jgi:hypothetical protein
MKLTLFSSASALALAAAFGQAHAAPDFTGVLQVYGGAGWSSDDNFSVGSDDPYFFGGTAKGYWPLSPDVHLQIDLFAQQTNNLVDHWGNNDATVFGASMHWLHPIGDTWRVGAAGSIWSNDVFDVSGPGSQTSVTYGLAALEAQYFAHNWSLEGQAGYFADMSCGSCMLEISDGEFVRGKTRYYFSENTALTAHAMQMWGSTDDSIFASKSLHSTTVGLQAEHKFDGSPYSASLGVSYERDAIDKHGSTSSIATTSLTLGFTYYLDQPSVESNERTGASLDTPTFGSATTFAGFLKF